MRMDTIWNWRWMGATCAVMLPPLPEKDAATWWTARCGFWAYAYHQAQYERAMDGQLHGGGKKRVSDRGGARGPAETLPVWPIARLFRFPPVGADGHRVKVQGVVLCVEPGGTTFIQDGTQAMQIQTRTAPRLVPGDFVEALGFLAGGGFYPVMEEAEIQFLKHGPTARPQPAEVEHMLGGQFGGQLVAVEGGWWTACNVQRKRCSSWKLRSIFLWLGCARRLIHKRRCRRWGARCE